MYEIWRAYDPLSDVVLICFSFTHSVLVQNHKNVVLNENKICSNKIVLCGFFYDAATVTMCQMPWLYASACVFAFIIKRWQPKQIKKAEREIKNTHMRIKKISNGKLKRANWKCWSAKINTNIWNEMNKRYAEKGRDKERERWQGGKKRPVSIALTFTDEKSNIKWLQNTAYFWHLLFPLSFHFFTHFPSYLSSNDIPSWHNFYYSTFGWILFCSLFFWPCVMSVEA